MIKNYSYAEQMFEFFLICQQFLYWIEDRDCNITTYLFKHPIKKFNKENYTV